MSQPLLFSSVLTATRLVLRKHSSPCILFSRNCERPFQQVIRHGGGSRADSLFVSREMPNVVVRLRPIPTVTRGFYAAGRPLDFDRSARKMITWRLCTISRRHGGQDRDAEYGRSSRGDYDCQNTC